MVRRNTVRFRITALATSVMALGLLASGVALVFLQRNALTEGLDQALFQRADDIGALFEIGDVPDRLPAASREGFAQLIAPDGSVVASTPNLGGMRRLALEPSPAGDLVRNIDGLEVDDDVFRVLTRTLSDGSVLHVATTYDSVGESVSTLIASMALVIPVLVIGSGALIWWMVGRTLQPVEDIRTEVAEIGVSDLHRRVPRPDTEDEIDRLAATMNEMLERVETSVERQQRFVADASHELRSPLTRLRSQLEVEINAKVPGAKGELLGDLLGEVVGMQNLVEDMLYLARADAGHGSGEFERLDLDDMLLREVRRVAARDRVSFDVSAVSGAHVNGDAGQLTRAIRNLLENAERHATSKVSLRLQEEDGVAVLTVSDDGPGIDPGDETRIFERFGRLDEARSSATGGAGLGLAIAREIAVRHGGSLVLGEGTGSGAIFEMRILLAGQ